jgi:hypothetical protein
MPYLISLDLINLLLYLMLCSWPVLTFTKFCGYNGKARG